MRSGSSGAPLSTAAGDAGVEVVVGAVVGVVTAKVVTAKVVTAKVVTGTTLTNRLASWKPRDRTAPVQASMAMNVMAALPPITEMPV